MLFSIVNIAALICSITWEPIMAYFAVLRPFIFIIFLFSCYSGKYSTLAVLQRTWCVTKPALSDQALQESIDYACSRTDCRPVEQGGACFNPNSLVQHTTFAMNAYYQARGRHGWDCDFKSSALVSLTDPSFGCCSYAGGVTEVDTSKTWCVAKPAASSQLLQSNIDFACQKVDCSPIISGGPCFNPNILMNPASFAMNLYYKTAASCDFNNSGLIVANDPSFGSCTYS